MNAARATRFLLVLAIVLGLFAGPNADSSKEVGAANQTPPIPPDAQFVPDEVVIQFNPGVSEAMQASARGRANAVRKEQIRTSATEGDLELASVPRGLAIAEAVRQLKGHPAVRFAEPNFIYTHDESSDDPYYTDGNLWEMYGDATAPANQYGSQAGEAWAAGKTGSAAVYVAVTDHGVRLDHPDLQANIWTNPFDPPDGLDNDGNGYADDIHGWDFANGNNTVYDVDCSKDGCEDETDGHGTHVAGTIGAVGGNGQGVAGVAWKVKLIVTKYLDDSGGTSANTPKVLDYLIDLKTRHKLNIVASNNSYGGSGYSEAVFAALTRAEAAGILFVASAGNDSRDNDANLRYPSSYGHDNIIAVAALDKDGNKRSSSNWGAKTVDLGAPGGEINSTLATGYGMKSGTSMAAPHVTGAAALYAAAYPGASAAQIKKALLENTAPTTSLSLSGKTPVLTGGRLDVATAIGAGAPGPTGTPTPTATATSTPGLTNTPTPTSAPTNTPTPTPTAAPTLAADTMHVADLEAASSRLRQGRWSARVTITVHDWQHRAVEGATVSGTFQQGSWSQAASCSTAGGSCSVDSGTFPSNEGKAGFTVDAISGSLSYRQTDNRDPDGDSNGTTITISK